LDEAIHCYRRALENDPRMEAALNNLGTALREQGKLTEAIAAFRQVVKTNPGHAMAWCNLGHSLNQQGEIREARSALNRGHELGSSQKHWAYPSAQWVKEVAYMVALEEKLPAVLRGETKPADVNERLSLAKVCLTAKDRPVAAVRFYTSAFEADP